MKRRGLSVLCAFLLMSVPLLASQGGPKTTTSKPPKPVKASSSKPAKSTTKPTTTAKATKPVTATKPAKETKSAKVEAKSSKKATTTAATTTTSTKETTPTTTPAPGETTVPLTKVQEKLQRNTKLAAKLEGRLPDGTDLMKAASGFKNLGQFVAAVNVSNNHEGISFTALKKLMVDEGYSLGQAMQKLKATDATTEARRAEYEANRMIETSEREIAAPTGVSASPAKTTTTPSTTTTSSSTTTTTTSKAKPKKKNAVGAQQ